MTMLRVTQALMLKTARGDTMLCKTMPFFLEGKDAVRMTVHRVTQALVLKAARGGGGTVLCRTMPFF